MGWVMMSERDLNRIEVLAQVDGGRLSVENDANMLDVTKRQIFRLLKRYRTEGAPAIRHRARGKAPNNKIHKAKRDYAVALVNKNYKDFGPTLATEMLAEHHGFKVSRETLRKWIQEDGIWLSRIQRRTFHRPRRRRECFGELIQIDGSDHRSFEDRADPCTLLVFIDDATSQEISRLCDDKQATKAKLIEAGVPVPDGILIEKTAPHKADLESFVQRHPDKRFHVKPLGGSLAVGAFGGLTAAELADCITEHDEQWLLVEEHILGFPFRVNVVGNEYVAAYACVPPRVIGDGTSTIVELVDQKNRSRRHKPLHPRRIVHLDERAETCLMEQGLTPASIPDIGQSVLINKELQTEQGADFVEATQTCSQQARELAVRACMAVDVPFGGVDILIDDESGRHVVLEVNQCPMLKGNVFPFYVPSPGNRVAEAIIDYYFPNSITHPRFTTASFDFIKVCNAIKSGCVSEVTLPVLTADWVHKHIKLPAGNFEESTQETIRTGASLYGVYVDIFKLPNKEVVLDVLGPARHYNAFLSKLNITRTR